MQFQRTILLLITLCSQAILADPFYGETSNETPSKKSATSTTPLAKQPRKTTACEITESTNEVNITVEFEDLKLIGIFKYNGKSKALFTDKQNQIFDFSENDLIKDKSLQIKEINTKFVKYINWDLTEDCQKPYYITLKI